MSKATQPMEDADLNQILKESVSWNKDHKLTGMLLYIQGVFMNQPGGRFIQVLEGKEADVREIFAKIKTDPRHQNVNVLTECDTKSRYFKGWQMGFKSMSVDEFKHYPGHFELDEYFLHSDGTNILNVPLTFLQSFYSMHFVGSKFDANAAG
jgi:hypothetical protein